MMPLSVPADLAPVKAENTTMVRSIAGGLGTRSPPPNLATNSTKTIVSTASSGPSMGKSPMRATFSMNLDGGGGSLVRLSVSDCEMALP